jgi:hypothetical protein
MYDKITQTAAGANICSAMGRETIQKSRVNSRKTAEVGGNFNTESI